MSIGQNYLLHYSFGRVMISRSSNWNLVQQNPSKNCWKSATSFDNFRDKYHNCMNERAWKKREHCKSIRSLIRGERKIKWVKIENQLEENWSPDNRMWWLLSWRMSSNVWDQNKEFKIQTQEEVPKIRCTIYWNQWPLRLELKLNISNFKYIMPCIQIFSFWALYDFHIFVWL